MIYEYECPLGHQFEVRRYFDASVEKCPRCRRMARRIMSVVNSSFGWRLTDASHEVGAIDELERDV